MYGNFVLFDDAGKLEKGEQVYLGEVKGKNEAWLRDMLFENLEIIPPARPQRPHLDQRHSKSDGRMGCTSNNGGISLG